jgi:hypothetical protein
MTTTLDPRLKGMVMALAGGDDPLARPALIDWLEERDDPRAERVRHLFHNRDRLAGTVYRLRNQETAVLPGYYLVLHGMVGRWRRGTVLTGAEIVAAGGGDSVLRRLTDVGAVRQACSYQVNPEGAVNARGHWVPSPREAVRPLPDPYRQELLIECRTREHVNALVGFACSGHEVPPDVATAFAAEHRVLVASVFPEVAAEIVG